LLSLLEKLGGPDRDRKPCGDTEPG
jgi:hypothetical protein